MGKPVILTLLGLVAESARLVGARGSRRAVHGGQLAVLPAAHAQQEAHDIALLLAPQLLLVLVHSHGWHTQSREGHRLRPVKGTAG